MWAVKGVVGIGAAMTVAAFAAQGAEDVLGQWWGVILLPVFLVGRQAGKWVQGRGW